MKFIAPQSFLLLLILTFFSCSQAPKNPRVSINFNKDWYFHLGDLQNENQSIINHRDWRKLNLPHDWSIEGTFSKSHPSTPGGGALPGGVGWYRKTFVPEKKFEGKNAFIQFDGVYMNSEVWVNGNYLGKRPFGYISFEFNLTPFLVFGQENTVTVKVDNSQQPNSRWYTGSGIYRNVRLVYTHRSYIPIWGTYVTTPSITKSKATVQIQTKIINASGKAMSIRTSIIDEEKNLINAACTEFNNYENTLLQAIEVNRPNLWSPSTPYLYTVKSEIISQGDIIDTYTTPLGIRQFYFDQEKGLIFNGESLKINGVCMHHDLGPLGAAVNRRALERQIEILKGMGVNAIRTTHNPPAPEFLDLCDEMGILVMNETFDIWSMKKSPYDYALYWEEWHEKDLTDHILRDRNHPSVFVWSIGNEIIDQWFSDGSIYAKKLAAIVRELDDSRPITAGMNPPNDANSIISSEALDLIGYNYHHLLYEDHQQNFPQTPFIATETMSTLATRGYYDERSDTLLRWPIHWDKTFDQGNPGNTVSAYDQVSPPWGSTHQETLPIILNNDFLSGMFIWTGFDYLGEPTPYSWPSRSSYFGIIDLAGFPKDSYYLYKSLWTDDDVLHLFPHWNWEKRDSVDVWAYFNADEVELFINGTSQGVKTKKKDQMQAIWRVKYQPGELKAVSRIQGTTVLEKTILTASTGANIRLLPDRHEISADGRDLSFVTVEVLDQSGILVPTANHTIDFAVEGPGEIVGVDNGDPTSHLAFKGSQMKAFYGKCLVVIQSTETPGTLTLTAKSQSLQSSKILIETKK